MFNAVAFSLDGKTLISGSRNGTLRVWNTETGENPRYAPRASGIRLGSLLFHRMGEPSRVVVHPTQFNYGIWIHDSSTLSLKPMRFGSGVLHSHRMDSCLSVVVQKRCWYGVHTPEHFTRGIKIGTGLLRFHQTERRSLVRDLAVRSGYGMRTRFMIVRILQNRAVFEGYRDSFDSLVFSPDGSTLASAGREGSILLWNVSNAQLKTTINGHKKPVSTLAFSPDGRTLASGSWDDTIRLWDAETGMLRRILNGHADGVTSVAFSPDGEILASGSYDGTVRLWDAHTGQDHTIFTGHTYEVNSVGVFARWSHACQWRWRRRDSFVGSSI